MKKNKQLELFAKAMHDVWANWMKYMFDEGEWDNGRWIMPEGKVHRWMRQMDTPYRKLSESEKDSDRDIAKQFLGEHIDLSGEKYIVDISLKKEAMEGKVTNILSTRTEASSFVDGAFSVAYALGVAPSARTTTLSMYEEEQATNKFLEQQKIILEQIPEFGKMLQESPETIEQIYKEAMQKIKDLSRPKDTKEDT